MSDLINVNAPSASLSVSTTSARVAIDGGYAFVLIDNTLAGNAECYVRSGLSNVAATTSHMHIAAITASGTTTLRLVRGGGE